MQVGIGEFINASFPLPWNPVQCPVQSGMGEYIDGRFPLPWNPVVWPRNRVALGNFGELQPASFQLPGNPVAPFVAGSHQGPCGICGMGSISDSLSSAWDSLSTSLGGSNLSTYALIGAAGLMLLWLMTPGGSEYRRKQQELADQYRGYRRVGRATKRVGAAITPAGLTRSGGRRR